MSDAGHTHDAGHSGHAHDSHGLTVREAHGVADRLLERAGQRYTAARRQVVDVLAAAGRPLTMPEILATDADLAQSSVYRNLSVLEDAGVVTRVVTTGESACFELTEELTGHHHHLVCSGCGTVRDVEIPPRLERQLDTVLAEVAAGEGFRLDGHRLDLVGRCPSCPP